MTVMPPEAPEPPEPDKYTDAPVETDEQDDDS